MEAGHCVLLVDPDAKLRSEVLRQLEVRHIEAREASSGAEAIEAALACPPTVLVCEMMLPDMTGLGLARALQDDPRIGPVRTVLLSSRSEEADRIVAFETGVDDFVAKPFSANELSVRIRAILRRSMPVTDPDTGHELAR